jgi:isoamylase
VVFNHTAEGNEHGPTLSFKGLENRVYYMLENGGQHYRNYTGCGNTLNGNHPIVREMIFHCLRHWVHNYHVDGFRFDLASILSRDREGNLLPNPPVVEAITEDPLLADTKIIAEAWDAAGAYQVGTFGSLRWAEWNGRYRDDLRRFWRGDPHMVGPLATRLAGSSDLYQVSGRRPYHSINFTTSHDGFTLNDLVSYNGKHNEANGEQNRDGTDANYSWNNGAEGATDDENILARRRRDQRNLLVTLFSARGLPMLAMGAECGHSQNGNNNAYAQDNVLTWLDWGKADEKLIAFTKKLIALRLSEAALHRDAFLTGTPLDDSGIPDAQWFSAEGAPMTEAQWQEIERRFLGLSLYAESSRVLLLFNAGDAVAFPLPAPRDGKIWRLAIDTCADQTTAQDFGEGEKLFVGARAVKILLEATRDHRLA